MKIRFVFSTIKNVSPNCSIISNDSYFKKVALLGRRYKSIYQRRLNVFSVKVTVGQIENSGFAGRAHTRDRDSNVRIMCVIAVFQ